MSDSLGGRVHAVPGRGGGRDRSGHRPAASVDGPGVALHPGRSGGRRAAGVRRSPVAPAGPAARLEHRGHAAPRTLPAADSVGFLPGGIGWYRKSFRAARRGSRPSSASARVRRRLHEQRRLDQRRPPRQAARTATSASRTTSPRTWCPASTWSRCASTTRRQPNSRWYTGSGIYRHVWLTHRRPAARGALGDVRDDAARRLRAAPTSSRARSWRTIAPRRAAAVLRSRRPR